MTTPKVMRDLDQALAQVTDLAVKAGQWKIRALKAEQDLADAKAQLELSQSTAQELIRMVDGLRSERDSWRAAAGR